VRPHLVSGILVELFAETSIRGGVPANDVQEAIGMFEHTHEVMLECWHSCRVLSFECLTVWVKPVEEPQVDIIDFKISLFYEPRNGSVQDTGDRGGAKKPELCQYASVRASGRLHTMDCLR
jgi:hypothetical protein